MAEGKPLLLWDYADFQRHFGPSPITVDRYGNIYSITREPVTWLSRLARWGGRLLAWLAVGHAVYGARRG